MEILVNYLWAFGIVALLFVFIKNAWVAKQEVGNPKMARIAKNIADGAMSFLKAEYKILAIFVLAVAVLLVLAEVSWSSPASACSVSVSFDRDGSTRRLPGSIRAATRNSPGSMAARSSAPNERICHSVASGMLAQPASSARHSATATIRTRLTRQRPG